MVLMDPDAADRIVDDILAAIYKRLPYADSFTEKEAGRV